MFYREEKRELLGLPFLFFTLLVLTVLPGGLKAQAPLMDLLLGDAPAQTPPFSAPADSGSRQIIASFDASPAYYEWSDSAMFHRDYRAEGYLRFQMAHDPWIWGAEYRYRIYQLTAHPVVYQDLNTRLSNSAVRIFMSRRLPFGLTPSAILGYDAATGRPDYHVSLGWSRFAWFCPTITYALSGMAHRTTFRLFQTYLQFDDRYQTRRTILKIASADTLSTRYTVTYATGKLRQPMDISVTQESQQTVLTLSHWYGALRFPLPGKMKLKAEFFRTESSGKSYWYSLGVRFADINKILFNDQVLSVTLGWRNLAYVYSHEEYRYNLYGQVRGFPFTPAALDLLGPEFVVSSVGRANIATHQFQVALGRSAQPSVLLTAGYLRAEFPQLDYRTYTLVLGFPRRETLRISRMNLQRADALRLAMQGRFRLTSRLSCLPMLQQFIPVHVKYVTTPQPGGPPARAKHHTLGGLRLTLQLRYDL